MYSFRVSAKEVGGSLMKSAANFGFELCIQRGFHGLTPRLVKMHSASAKIDALFGTLQLRWFAARVLC